MALISLCLLILTLLYPLKGFSVPEPVFCSHSFIQLTCPDLNMTIALNFENTRGRLTDFWIVMFLSVYTPLRPCCESLLVRTWFIVSVVMCACHHVVNTANCILIPNTVWRRFVFGRVIQFDAAVKHSIQRFVLFISV